MLALTENNQAQTLEAIAGLPPREYLDNVETRDQLEHWLQTAFNYECLHQSFKDYFQGASSRSDEMGLSPKELEFFDLLRDRYLSWYTLVQRGWKLIEAQAEKDGFDLDSYASSPGEALIRVIENECTAVMRPAFLPWFRWSPSQARELASQDRKLNAAIASNPELTPKQRRDLKTYQAKLTQARQEFEKLANFEETCVAICESHKANNPTLRRYLQDYRRIRALLDGSVQSAVHERHKRRGFEWRRGQKIFLSQHGGKPSS